MSEKQVEQIIAAVRSLPFSERFKTYQAIKDMVVVCRAASTTEAAGLSEERITEIAHALWDELDDGKDSTPWEAPGKHQSNIRRWYRRYARAAVKVLSAAPSGEQAAVSETKD